MNFLRQQWRQINAQFTAMSPNTKWALGLVAIVLVLVLVLTLLVTGVGATDEESLGRWIAPEYMADAGQVLRNQNIEVGSVNGDLTVSKANYFRALGVLQSQGYMVGDTSRAFDELLKEGDIWESAAQLEQRVLRGKERMLGMIIREMHGVQSSNVLIAVHKKVGFGSNHVKPSASVSVKMNSGRPLDRDMVNAIAGLVSGAVAEMPPQNVQVVDAGTGRIYTARPPGDFSPEENLLVLRQREEYYHEKFLAAFSEIPNLLVAVNVQIDNVGSKTELSTQYSTEQPLTSQRETTMERSNTSDAGEPGARPNVGSVIPEATGPTTTEKQETRETQFADLPLINRTEMVHVPQRTQQVNVTMRIPKSYFLAISAKPAGEGEQPADEAWDEAMVNGKLTQYKTEIEPLIEMSDRKGVVSVTWYDDGPMQVSAAGMLPVGEGMMTRIANSGMAQPIALTLLALTAVAIMLSMARKANQRPSMPTAAELAGVPPTLPTDEDLLGEVVESEPAMAGVEVNEADIRSRKIANQISELIRANPPEASNLFNKWVQTTEEKS